MSRCAVQPNTNDQRPTTGGGLRRVAVVTQRAPRSRTLVGAAVLLAAIAARGDGGLLRLKQAAGPFDISVFTAPTPLRVGQVDVSVMVLRRTDHAPVLDADVELRLRGASGELRATATVAAASNKLLYAALIEVPAPGRWTLSARVDSGESDVTVAVELDVAPALGPAWAFWPYLMLPGLVIALFAVNQWLRGTHDSPQLNS
jgi:hypothetical protein